MHKIIVAIDGYSGTGKSSTAKSVAQELDYIYIDSGAMYRATTLFFLDRKVDLSNAHEVENALNDLSVIFKDKNVLLNGQDVTDEIRTMHVNNHVSEVAANSAVRKAMVAQQQKMGEQKGIVMDGRDIATVVFPNAELKVFMTASADVRAKRRQKELLEKGIYEELNAIKNNLLSRDQKDSSREDSPLQSTNHSVEIDTSDLTFNQQVEKVVKLAKEASK